MLTRWFYISVSVILFLLLFFPSASWRIQELSRFGFLGNPRAYEDLRSENIKLKLQLAEAVKTSCVQPKSEKKLIPAFVYSQYPLPFKNEYIISAGAKDGVKTGAAVLFSGTDGQAFVVGKITRVLHDYAVVQTIFDKNFKMAVRIGQNGTDALLSGGTVPQLTLIPKAKPIEPGQAVYSASADAPYGTAIGQVGVVTVIPETSMQEAELLVPYDPNSVHSVLVEVKNS